MKILLTGANGYIGKRLLPVLLEQGHKVVCCVRNKERFAPKELNHPKLEVIEADLLKRNSLDKIPTDIEISYYLIHSMLHDTEDFDELEKKCALNFIDFLKKTENRQIIYLSGIANEEKLSKHLKSRKEVEEILKQSRSYLKLMLYNPYGLLLVKIHCISCFLPSSPYLGEDNQHLVLPLSLTPHQVQE